MAVQMYNFCPNLKTYGEWTQTGPKNATTGVNQS